MVNESRCTDGTFPFQGINNNILFSLFCDQAVTNRKLMCFGWKKRTEIGTYVAHCYQCRYDFHLKCEQINNKDIPLPPDWICLGCTMKALPFGNINDENMKLAYHGLSDECIDFLMDKCLSFSIKSLLDEMLGQKINTYQFMSNSILSKYYTTSDFFIC